MKTMKRRGFIQASALSGCGLAIGSADGGTPPIGTGRPLDRVFSADGNRATIRTATSVKPLRVFHLTDTHLAIRDGREDPFRQYSDRMAGGYRVNRHFLTGLEISAEAAFEETLALAKAQRADFLALTGDILSFPSEAAVEWVVEKLKETGIPYAYVAGNHDWHYEGMPGSSIKLRETWIEKRLKPLYQGMDPLCAVYDLAGIRFVCIDNSVYEILPEQLEFFNTQVATGMPLILLIHIPMFIPGRPVGYGCGHPDWGPETDMDFKLERRDPWHGGGQSKATFDFHQAVFAAPNLLAILAGHTHRQAIDVKNNIPQWVGGHNANGFFTDLRINPL